MISIWEKIIADAQDSSQDLLVSATDTGEFVVLPGQGHVITKKRALLYLLCGGTAGAVSRLAVAPLIRVKMIMQTQAVGQKPKVTGILQGME